jgi:serine O-acetyltransferase
VACVLTPTKRGSRHSVEREPRLRSALAQDIRRSLHPFGLTPLTWRRVLVQLLLSSELRLVVAFRLYSWLDDHTPYPLAYIAYMVVRGHTGCDLALGAEIGPGLRIEHRSDIVIGSSAALGSDVDVYNGVTVGKRRPPSEGEMPRIGSRVSLGTGAKVLGGITLGDDVVVAANAVVIDDVDPDTTVVGIPARPARSGSQGRRPHNDVAESWA